MQRLIGLWGYARAGKDTVGGILVERFGFTRVAFADTLRMFALAVNPYVSGVTNGHGPRRLSWWVAEKGWEGAKEHPEVRRLLQVIGTEAGRNIIGENVWVDAAFKSLDPNGSYVFTDMRFPNEMQAIKDRGGKTWKIRRPGYGPVNGHISETALENADFTRVINNDRDLTSLYLAVENELQAQEKRDIFFALHKEPAGGTP